MFEIKKVSTLYEGCKISSTETSLVLGSVALTKCYSADQIKTNEMGGARSTFTVEERCVEGFGGET